MKPIRKALQAWFKNRFGSHARTPATHCFRPGLEQLERRDVPTVTFHGGPVLANVEIQALYLGSDWNGNTPITTDTFDAFLAHISDSDYMDMLNEAGYGVGRGYLAGSAIDGSDLPSVINDADIQNYIDNDINSGLLAAPDDNTLYFVNVEPGVQVDGSPPGYGYHSSFTGQGDLTDGTVIPYAVVPDSGSLDDATGAFNNMTVTSSHELTEAATDPFGNGWYDGDQEIGDIVNAQSVLWDGYWVQLEAAQDRSPIDPNMLQFYAPNPQGPAGDGNSETPTFTWDGVDGADHYNLWVTDLTTDQSPVLQNADVTDTSFTFDQPLAPGHDYRYWVQAVDTAGFGSDWSAPQDFSVARVGAPDLYGPTGSINQLTPTFSWSAIDGADHYDLYVSDLTTGQSPVLRNANVTDTSFTFDQNLTPGHSYEFWVAAVDGNGFYSDWSGPADFSVPALPVPSPTAPSGSAGETPAFSWSGVDGTDHYDLWVTDLTTGQSPVLHNDNVTDTTLTFDQPLAPGHSYRFWVRDVDSLGNASDWSSGMDFSVAALPVPAIVGPAGSTTDKAPAFSWTIVPGANHYDLWVSDLTTGQVLENPDVTGTSFTFSQLLVPDHSYESWVRAFDSNGFASGWSAGLSVTLPPLAVPVPKSPTNLIGDTTPTFSWNAVAGANHYDVWVSDLTTGQVLHNPEVTDNSFTFTQPLVSGHNYRYWVREFDDAGNASAWSSPVDFGVSLVATPAGFGPSSSTTSTTPQFTWYAVTGADHYEIWVNNLTTGQAQVLWNTNVQGTTWSSPVALSAGDTYRWWVRAFDSAGDVSFWSSALDFTVV
jgi:predicted phage tail protein